MAAKRGRSGLAILGGKPAVTMPQDEALRWPAYGKDELRAVTELVRRGEVSVSSETTRLEQEFARFQKARYVVAHNNGTAAGLAGFFALGLQPGDEVICPSFTFWASVFQTLWLGAKPVFAEIVPETLNLDPEDLARRITPRTRAVVVVHMLGVPADMDAVMRIARRHRLKVIEDCSHAHGATYRGRKVGSFGDVAFFSLQASKVLPAGEGGIFVTDRKSCYERALVLGHYERSGAAGRLSRFSMGLGFKFRIHPLAAALARQQLKRLPATIRRTRANAEYFLRGLRRLRLWDVPRLPRHVRRVHYQLWEPLRLELLEGVGKERFIEALRAEGVRAGDARYHLLHQNALFQDGAPYGPGGFFPAFVGQTPPLHPTDACPVSDRVRQSLVHFPTFAHAPKGLIDQYLTALRKVEEHLDELRT